MRCPYIKLICLSLFLITLLSLAVSGFAENTTIDPVSGQRVDDSGRIQLFYQEHFDQLYRKYEKELSDQEIFCSTIVGDGIANIDYNMEKGIPFRDRVLKAATLDDLRGLLAGFFDHTDAAYTRDEPVLARLRAIFDACGLKMDDYHFSVTRNMPGLPEPFTPRETTWSCSFLHKDKEVGIVPDDIDIILHGDEMRVGRFVMDPWNTPDEDEKVEEE